MYKYKVLDNNLITPTVRQLTLTVSEGSAALDFLPGQYAAIVLKDKVRPTVARCFSITSSPLQPNTLQFSMRVKGRYTSAVGRLKPGDAVEVRGPFGGFVLDQYHNNNVVLFAGGIGIAPFMSMLRFLHQTKTNMPLHLIYSVRDETDIAFQSEITKITHEQPNIKVTYVVASPKQSMNSLDGVPVVTGQLEASVLRQLQVLSNDAIYYVCGPPPYMQAVFKMLSSLGVAQESIHSEAFSQKGSLRQTGVHRSWPFNMYALTGVSLLVAGFLIAGADLYKTLPSLQSKVTATEDSNSSSQDITSIAPQVDTNISQAPDANVSNTSTDSTTNYPTNSSQNNSNSSSNQNTITTSPTVTNPTTPPSSTVS